MRWQNPIALIGMAALALPVLIHLFSRRPTRVELFPSLRFFSPSRIRPTRRTRITDIALLVVRLAIVATAVAALSGPLIDRSRNGATGGTGVGNSPTPASVVVIVDTTAMAPDSVAARRLADRIAQVTATSAASIVVRTGTPYAALRGAVAWLNSQATPHHLVVMSDFRQAALDSLDLVALPAGLPVQLERVGPAGTPFPLAQVGTVVWHAGASHNRGSPASDAERDPVRGADRATVRDAVFRAVIARGGARLVLPESATAQTSRSAQRGNVAHDVVVALPDADSLAIWQRTAVPLSAAWMGDVIAALNHDTTFATALHDLHGISDTAFTQPFVVVGRSDDQAPIIAVAAIPDSAGVDRLLIVSRAPMASVTTAALLLAASNAIDGDNAAASRTQAIASDAVLRTWERAPSATRNAARDSTRDTVRRAAATDVYTGPSDGRYLWLLVIALMVAETFMRRPARQTALSGSDDTSPGRLS